MIGTLFAAIAGFANIIGGAAVLAPGWRYGPQLEGLVGFGAGFMLSVALLDMAPHAVQLPGGFMAILAGYLVVHLTQHVMTPHFHFGEETHSEAMVSRGVGVLALLGLVPHAFFDGVAVAGGFLESRQLGLMIFFAIVLHKVPTGVSLASIMVASGNTIRNAFIAVLLVALATIVGAAATPLIRPLATWGLALATGVTIYVAASNLIPESQRQRSRIAQIGVFVGVFAFLLVRLLLPGA